MTEHLLAQVKSNAVFSTICAGDLATALEEAVNTFDAACRQLPPVD